AGTAGTGTGGAPAAAGSSGGVGVAGGGNVAGGPAAPPEPELVTSAKDDYWKVGTLTKGGTAATVTVTSASTAQAWDGFGGTFNEKGAQMLMGLDAAKQAEIMKKLFDVKDGIGFTWGRIPIGPSDYAIERYNFQASATAAFSIDHDKTVSATSKAPIMPYVKAAKAVKQDIKFWGSPWTPPPWMKTGASTAADSMGYDKGSMINTKDNLDKYATYLVNWIKAYETEGIKIDFIVPQNEPGWAQAYPSCAWGSYYDGNAMMTGKTFMGDFITANLSPAMKAATLTTNIWYGTFSNAGTYNDYWANLPADKTLVKGVALQWATDTGIAAAAAAGFKVMQSEHKCGNYPWLTAKATSEADANRDNFLADHAPNNHAYGEESWDLIKGWIDKGVNSYSAWNMILDKGGFNLDKSRPWPQNALIVVDGTTVKYTAAYYVFRHVAQFVEPGATVLKVTGGNALAFKNPDGTVVTIMYNSGASAAMTTLSIDGTLYQVSVPSHGWATVNKKG
ncbi:MAG TPA: glycoside hydrolase family 30 protein, partial [Polyangiaceae bacterium]|nr:glycoside hydrolase family 30 protein [Polyangiaceae bacterium]